MRSRTSHRRSSLFIPVVTLGLLAGPAACSSDVPDNRTDPGGNPPAAGLDGGRDDVDADDPVNQPPHALGTITLGETHASDESSAHPFVTASFVPDALAARSCGKKLDQGCEIVEAPRCGTSAGGGCNTGEVCTLDKSCASTCQKVPVCSKECSADEFCTLDDARTAICARVETFDAGPLAFGGTTTAITLFPPYAFRAPGSGAPFIPGAKLEVHAQGPTAAGFEGFAETFTATSFVQSRPKLSTISRAEAFGSEALPLSWVPGKESILITLTGGGGSVTCKANDADGKFDVPRTAVDAALGDGSPALSISVSRQRKETKKGLKTKGQLSNATVQPDGWLDLVTTSSETVTVIGCPSGQSACGEECIDLKTDRASCGACGKACPGSQACDQGTCSADACTTCQPPLEHAIADQRL